ncbi:hypothetical protein NIES2100_20210 [Calothrix sp. NIES-2100]|uniref:GUN4 domain-containing protein n=1 Tax=Calothrix sp. NIES-2100 TaxID=1954172 RepID=UPI000B5E6000|nr:hypothetical protein NIES2100_20210 [Calothrix sp. NIES-2100]
MNDEIPVKTILVLSANPKGTQPLRLHEEIREIKEGLQLAKQRDRFKIDSAEAVRHRDISRSILNFEPQIVHFSGHGAGEPGLIFEDNTGQQKLVDAEALAGLFKLFADKVECVLLNACYSKIQAQAIAQHINYVIGMSQEIGDKAAIEFAVGFYDALGAGRDFEFAYKYGCQVIRMAGIQEHLTPQLLKKEDWQGKSINTTYVPTSPPPDARTTAEKQRQKQETNDLPSEKGVDYTKLRDLLAAGKWKDADQETLVVMLQATGRQKEGYLDSKSIENFPCTDLRTIDQLWIQYSKGLFGFSVQKRIWESVSKDHEKFGDRVGWRKGMFLNKEWLSYSQLTFSLNAPQGHLPNGIQNRSIDGEHGRVVLLYGFESKRIRILASRLETCEV